MDRSGLRPARPLNRKTLVTGNADADARPNFKAATPGAEDRLRKD